MRKSFLIIIAGCMLAALLAGCQLAKPDAESGQAQDRLIGVLVTTEPLDMMDSAYTEPVTIHLSASDLRKLEQGDGSVLDFPERKYEAQLITEDDGRQVWSFDHLGGWAILSPTMYEDGEEYIASYSTNGLCEVQTHIKSVNEDVNELELSAALYQVSGAEDTVFEMNPIYQTADGLVYATPGTGAFSSGVGAEGIHCTQTLNAEVITTAGSAASTCRSEVAVSFGRMYRPKSVILLQMDRNGTVLSREEYEPGALPDSIIPEKETAFFIVETVKRDPNGAEVITAELVDQGDASFSTFYAEGSICIPQTTSLLW